MHLAFLFFSVLAAAAFFAGSLVLTSMGYHYGKRYLNENGQTSVAGLGSIEAAIFALAGLLIAFSFSGALERFDERRKLMTAEGNAISTAYDRLDMMENDRKLALKSKVKEYFGSCPGRWCRSRLMAVLSDIEPEGYQRATAGRLICGSSLICAMVSSVR
ncbi:hypothetical protein [Sinorhizobium meliloti]